MADRGAHPVEWLRGLALSLERLAVEGVASGAVRGAAGELRAGMPEDLDARVQALLQDGLTALARLAAEAARSPSEGPSLLAAWSRTTAGSAVRGAIEELRRLSPELRPATQELLVRAKLWLERTSSEAAERARVIQQPGDRARIAAAGAVAGAVDQLGRALPVLAMPAADFAAQVGRGLVRGVAEEARRQLQAAGRSPLLGAVLAGAAVVVVLLAVRRMG